MNLCYCIFKRCSNFIGLTISSRINHQFAACCICCTNNHIIISPRVRYGVLFQCLFYNLYSSLKIPNLTKNLTRYFLFKGIFLKLRTKLGKLLYKSSFHLLLSKYSWIIWLFLYLFFEYSAFSFLDTFILRIIVIKIMYLIYYN